MIKPAPGGKPTCNLLPAGVEGFASLAELAPAALRVEINADGIAGGTPQRQEMKRVLGIAGDADRHVYSAAVPAVRPPADYMARMTPRRDGVAMPLEEARILWQR